MCTQADLLPLLRVLAKVFAEFECDADRHPAWVIMLVKAANAVCMCVYVWELQLRGVGRVRVVWCVWCACCARCVWRAWVHF